VLVRLSYSKPLGFRVKTLGSLAKVITSFQYPSGNMSVVRLRSASVMTQILVLLLGVYAESRRNWPNSNSKPRIASSVSTCPPLRSNEHSTKFNMENAISEARVS